MKNKFVLLLTACVNPSGMSATKIQNINVRRKQYEKALRFYLDETSFPVVFCENTEYDFSNEYKNYIDSGRLEYITFNGNNYDKSRGKGYGEALIILYALNHSNLIKESKYIFKITGRVIIRNIEYISNSPFYYFENVFRSDYGGGILWPNTVLFSMRPDTLYQILANHKDEIKEGNSGEWVFERILARAIVSDHSINIVPFFFPTKYEGVSGTTGINYMQKDWLYNVSDNIYFSADMYNRQGHYIIGFLFRLIYYILMILRKVLRK